MSAKLRTEAEFQDGRGIKVFVSCDEEALVVYREILIGSSLRIPINDLDMYISYMQAVRDEHDRLSKKLAEDK